MDSGNPEHTIRHDTSKRHIDKYENKGLLHQMVLGRFLDFMAEALAPYQSSRVLDFGCGEALFWKEMRSRGVQMADLTGIDLREDALSTAKMEFPEHEFIETDLLQFETKEGYDLVIASQVLEHLPEPEKFLTKLVELPGTSGRLLLTVPWEPFFMLSNLARGRDVFRLGNHPEHINRWGKRAFREFVGNHATLVKMETVFPFIAVTAAPVEGV